MNKNAKRWVEALRSGEYTQGIGKLSYRTYSYATEEYTPKHCCLGVACQLYMKEHPEYSITELDDEFRYGPFGERYHLPVEVKQWLNIRDTGGKYADKAPDGEVYTEGLASLNDGGSTFEEIAATIEGEPIGLFATKTSVKKYNEIVEPIKYAVEA